VDQIQQFIDNLPNAIPQCKLCPQNIQINKIKSGTKKIKIVKKTKN